METQPLLDPDTSNPRSQEPQDLSRFSKNRLLRFLAGFLGAFLIVEFFILPGPKEKIHYDFEIRDLVWGNINFLHTTDTHGWYSGHLNQQIYHANWGDFISFASRLREIANVNKQDLLLVDTGDRHDGNGFSDITVPNGKVSMPIFLQQDYDLVTIGNHELYEFENSKLEFETVVTHYGEKYVCSNVQYLSNGSFVDFGNKYRYFTTPNQNIRILSMAFLFDFKRFNNGTKVTPIKESIKQDWFSQVLKDYPPEKVDLLVIFGHIPISHDWTELYDLHHILRENYPETKIQYFGGHSHIRDFTVFDENATGLQSGRFCETLGWSSINLKAKPDAQDGIIEAAKEIFHRSYIDFNLKSFYHHARATSFQDFDTALGLNVSAQIVKLRKKLHLDKALGKVTKSNYYVSFAPIDHESSIFHLLTHRVLPTLPSPHPEKKVNNRVIIINTGSIRYDLYKGPYTIDSQFIVSPFENDWVSVTVPKRIAVQVARVLNEAQYIMTEELRPPHFWDISSKVNSDSINRKESYIVEKSRLSKGYETFDDFGHSGDDTPHRPVVNYPIPNVVESVQIADELDDDSPVDLVFYSFITKNIIWALKELNYEDEVNVNIYSKVYLGSLLTSFVRNYDI